MLAGSSMLIASTSKLSFRPVSRPGPPRRFTFPGYDLPTDDSIRRSGQHLFSDTTANTLPGCILAVNANGRRTPQERLKMSCSVADRLDLRAVRLELFAAGVECGRIQISLQ